MSVYELHDDEPQQLMHDSKRPHSIDLTMELERQLDTESLPPTSPAVNSRPQSLDHHVLASIITQLRLSLSEVTKERNELRDVASSTVAHEDDLKNALQHVTEKSFKIEEELEAARKKIREDDESIAMLRTKVEESRRALMRLQTENRRTSQSNMSIDMSRAGLPFGTPASNKRMSFTPLTGAGAGRVHSHRRISSVSDSGYTLPDIQTPNSPSDQSFAVLNSPVPSPLPSPNPPPVSSIRFSGLFGRTSPPQVAGDPALVEAEALRQQMNSLKSELDETRHELSESNEAREASEMCVKALRQFIEDNNVGHSLNNAPAKPLPASASAEDEISKKDIGWGFNKLWKGDVTKGTSGTPAMADSAHGSAVGSPQAALISKKIGDFFSSRTSVSSSSSSTAPQRPRSSYHAQEPMFNGSDTSSVDDSLPEPISPTSEALGATIVVRDHNRSSLSPDLYSTSDQTKRERGPEADIVQLAS